MNKSDSIGALAAALVQAQGEIKGATKDAKNPHFRNQYATLESVVDAVRGPFAKHGLAYTQLLSDGGADVLIETVLIHSSGEWLSAEFRIPAPRHDPQGYGSAVTYGRRYALAAIAGIAQVDDDGEAARVASSGSASQVNRDEFDLLSDAAKEIIVEWAAEITALVNDGDVSAALAIAARCDTQEDRMALWSQLGPKPRAALKKANATQRTN